MIQTRSALDKLNALLPGLRFEIVPLTTPGDRDRVTDLKSSAPDFFTRDLDRAVREARLDAALHSAKDVPDPLPDGLDECWLPWQEDPRDVWVMRRGATADAMPAPLIGVSSERRETYARRRFPAAVLKPVRGTIEERLRQLDEGGYDILLMAAAALVRLKLTDRISEWISQEDLAPPAGQGTLSLTFRSDDVFWLRLRSLLVKPVIFAGAGTGSRETCTIGALEALRHCDVCFHDSLLDPDLLSALPPQAERVNVGKRSGCHKQTQSGIDQLVAAAARRGRRVVRLKGGDPGIFGRLAEEIVSLDRLQLPYRVIPGVSSLNLATTGTGLLLTERGIARGFTAMTPRQEDGRIGSVQSAARNGLPLVFFMGVGVLEAIRQQLLADGLPATTPAALVLDAGAADETIIRGTLEHLADQAAAVRPASANSARPGLILVGAPAARMPYRRWGALAGTRVLLPGSEALQKKSVASVRDFDGIPLSIPLIRMAPEPDCIPVLRQIRDYDWLVITSPSAVHCLMRQLPDAGVDLRDLPRIMVAGPGTAAAFNACGIKPDGVPHRNFGTAGLVEAAGQFMNAGASVLRLRSQLAGPVLGQALTNAGFQVRDCVLYRNLPVHVKAGSPTESTPGMEPIIPDFDAVFFASASAVEAFMARRPPGMLEGKTVMAIGRPTLRALRQYGVQVARQPLQATIEDGLQMLAAVILESSLKTNPQQERDHDQSRLS